MKLEDLVQEIHTAVHNVDTRTRVIETQLDVMQDAQAEHKEEMHTAKDKIDRLESVVDKAKGGAKLVVLLSMLIGVLVGLSKLSLL
jgi:polyhydroxyalkanoate synthesis regulator phasin